MKTRTLIIGCGYIGLPLGLRLMAEGQEVSAWVHSAASAEALRPRGFKRIIVGSVGHAEAWETVTDLYDQVIHGASSGRGGPEAYEEVFGKGVSLMNRRQPQARRLFVSSTSVFGQTAGEWVTEETAAEPSTVTGKLLRTAEVAAIGADAMVVRSSGIYGPGRGVLFDKFRRGEAVMEGDGSRWLNMIHQRDLVVALAHLLSVGKGGQIYQASDDTPVRLRDFYAWCSAFLGQPLPPSGPADPNRKRGLTSKRVGNGKLRGTGWEPVYPSFREGLAADHERQRV